MTWRYCFAALSAFAFLASFALWAGCLYVMFALTRPLELWADRTLHAGWLVTLGGVAAGAVLAQVFIYVTALVLTKARHLNGD
jgi:hypothetical protein